MQTAVFLALALGVGSSAYAQVSANGLECNGREVSFECSNGACELVLEIIGRPGCRLRIDDDWLSTHKQPRITEATALTVRIVGANLLRYGLKFETKEKVVDSYVDLQRLWRQVLTLVPGERERAVASEFVLAIKNWRETLVRFDSGATSFVAGFKGLTLACGERDTIGDEVAKVEGWVAELERLRKRAADLTTEVEHFPLYDSTLAAHDTVVSRLRAFEMRGMAAADGFIRRVTFGEAGRIVTLTITMVDLASGNDARVAEVVEFFVHSTLPVTFHAGYSYSFLHDFEFEKLAAAAGDDLFSQINESKTTSGMAAFLSYRVGTVESRRSDIFLTLGTDLSDPGKRLFIGATRRVKKFLISGGIATASVRQADEGDKVTDILDTVGGLLRTRELFTRIHTGRQWRPFVAITFAPF